MNLTESEGCTIMAALRLLQHARREQFNGATIPPWILELEPETPLSLEEIDELNERIGEQIGVK